MTIATGFRAHPTSSVRWLAGVHAAAPLLRTSVIVSAQEGAPPARTGRELVSDGMNLFRRGDVGGSARAFDEAIAAEARLGPYLWQRCVSDPIYNVLLAEAGWLARLARDPLEAPYCLNWP